MSSLIATHAGILVKCPQCAQMNRVPFARATDAAVCGTCHADMPADSSPIAIDSDEAFESLVREAPVPVLVDFWAAWCGPCRMVAPEIEKVAAASAGRYLVAKADTEALQETAQRLQISSIPALAVFTGGQEVAREVGARPAAAIQQFLEGALRSAPAEARR